MMISQNFDIRELVHPDIWNHPAIGDRCIDFLHPNLSVTLEEIKHETADILTINDWHWGGSRVNSGLRVPNDNLYAKMSAHKFGVAVDIKPKHMSAEELYYHILSNQDKYPFIKRIEDISATPTWVHIEVGSKRFGDIIVFNP